MSILATLPHDGIGRRWSEEVRERSFTDPTTDLVFEHHGAVCPDVVHQLVSAAERDSLDREEGVTVRKRLINVVLEGLENVHHHALTLLREASFAVLLRDQRGYVFAAGNAVPLATAALLAHRFGILNEMDDADLKEHYLKLLSNDARSVNGGAGLGLLTMVRKCVRPILVRSSTLGSNAAFFALELRVDRAL